MELACKLKLGTGDFFYVQRDDITKKYHKWLSIYYVSSYKKAGSFRMLTTTYLREQGFIQKLMSYENPH